MTAGMTPNETSAGQTVPPGWEGILDRGERILWQGRPVPGFSMAPFQPLRLLMGVFFTVFSVFWMGMAGWITGMMDDDVPILFAFFPFFGLPFLFAGLWNAGVYAIWRSYARGHTTYTLTSKRGIIARDLPVVGRTMKSYVITSDNKIDLKDSDPGTVWFAEHITRSQNRTATTPIGFVRIADARKVYGLMREIQNATNE